MHTYSSPGFWWRPGFPFEAGSADWFGVVFVRPPAELENPTVTALGLSGEHTQTADDHQPDGG